MGSGKTTIGKKLAKRLNLTFIDMDQYIEEKEKLSISDMFAKNGEEYFREIEHNVLVELLSMDGVLVSTGGGAPCFHQNILLINQQAYSIYLKLDPEILVGRLKNATADRPLLANLSNEELRLQISEKLASRSPFYEQAKLVFSSLGSVNRDVSELERLLTGNRH